jgi:chemotaxis protein methyltransferase CheR
VEGDPKSSGGAVKINIEPRQLESFRAAVAQRLGLRFDDSKLDELADVMRLRMGATNSRDVESYLYQFGTSTEELRAAVGHLTVPETFFFRIGDHFRALAEVVLPSRVRALGASKRLNILSAGCASGEEPFSIAMVLRGRADLAGWQLTIRGVDVNPKVIAKARIGRYSEWSMREISPELKERYFHTQGRNFQLHDSIREMVLFEEGNLADSRAPMWQPGTYDVIFFRNVLMYFSPEAASAVIGRMAQALAPGGYLLLGPAETLRGVSQEFHLCHTHSTFYYQRRTEHARDVGDVMQGFAPVTIAPKPGGDAVRLPDDTTSEWLNAIRLSSERIETLARTPIAFRGVGERPLSQAVVAQKRAPADVSTALDLLQKERFEEALDFLHDLPAESPANADVQLLRAVLLANSGDLAGAEKACTLLLKTDELNAGAHYVMALCHEQAGDRHSATEHDQTAVYLDPSFAMPHLHLGLLAKRAGELDIAKHELHQALLLLPRDDSSRILLFGGGFSRDALVRLCGKELQGCGGPS